MRFFKGAGTVVNNIANRLNLFGAKVGQEPYSKQTSVRDTHYQPHPIKNSLRLNSLINSSIAKIFVEDFFH